MIILGSLSKDNDNNRLKLSNGITNMLMHDFKINTKEKEYSVIGNNLEIIHLIIGQINQKGPLVIYSYGGEDEKCSKFPLVLYHKMNQPEQIWEQRKE